MEYRCPDPQALVRAANVKATLDAFRLLPSFGQRLIERHDLALDDLTPENYVLVQSWLNALREIADNHGRSILREVGRAIIVNGDFPPLFKSVESVLLAVDDIYHLNHKGEVGHYYASQLDDGAISVRCETPYPREFERGLIEGIASHEGLRGDFLYTVDYEDGPPDADHTCTLTVRKAAKQP